MKKLMMTATVVAIAMIGLMAVLYFIPCNKGCCGHHGHGNKCEMRDGRCGGEDNEDGEEAEDGDGHMHVRKEVRVIMGDSGQCSMTVNGKSCPMENGSCGMSSGSCGDQMMNMHCCCCCCMMMNGGGGMCHKGDSMKIEVKIDTMKKVIKGK